jgi:hypothetical protein
MPPQVRFERTDIWREGKWLDLWSVVHFLSGVSFGLGMMVFGFGTVASIVIVFLLLVGYEMWEAMVKIHETPQNRFMDVVVGMTSFLPTFFFLHGLSTTYFILTFGLVLTLNIVLAVFGWLASQKAAGLEEKLRSEFIEQRRLMRERRERRRLQRLQRQNQ